MTVQIGASERQTSKKQGQGLNRLYCAHRTAYFTSIAQRKIEANQEYKAARKRYKSAQGRVAEYKRAYKEVLEQHKRDV